LSLSRFSRCHAGDLGAQLGLAGCDVGADLDDHGVVLAIALQGLIQTGFLARDVAAQARDDRVGHGVRRDVSIAGGLGLAAAGVGHHAAQGRELGREVIELGGFGVELFVGDEDALVLLRVGQLVLGDFELLAGQVGALFEEVGVLLGRRGLELDGRVDVGLGKTVGQGGGKLGVDRVVADLDDVGFA